MADPLPLSLGRRSVRRLLLDRALTRASAPGGEGYAAAMLPRLERTVPRTPLGAALVRSLCTDERWAARYLAARALAGLAPAHVEPAEAWECLLALARDPLAAVRQGAAWGLGTLVIRAREQTAPWLERLLADPDAQRSERKAALRSLVVLALEPATSELAERLLRRTALAPDPLARGVWVLVSRGIGARDPQRAQAILDTWSASEQSALREQAARAQRRPLAPSVSTGAPR